MRTLLIALTLAACSAPLQAVTINYDVSTAQTISSIDFFTGSIPLVGLNIPPGGH